MGRPLRLRIHLGAYILQQIFNKTDRQIEYGIKDNAGSSIGLRKPGVPTVIDEKEQKNAITLSNRRTGIEPLIGHAKHGGQLGKSRMKYDRTTESAGYAAILGFNGRQLIRYLKGAPVICK